MKNKNPNQNIASRKVYEVARLMIVKPYTGNSDCRHYLEAGQAIGIINELVNPIEPVVKTKIAGDKGLVELWVQKSIYRRYLIKKSEIEEVKVILNNNTSDSIDMIGDCYDMNKNIEYDDEETIIPIEYEISNFI